MKRIILIVILISLVVLSGCSNFNSEENSKKPQSEINLNEKPASIDLKFVPLPNEELKEGKPDENWLKAKSIYFGDLPQQIETTVHLYLEQPQEIIVPNGGIVHAYIEHNKKLYKVQDAVSSYGIDNVDIKLEDKTNDDLKEIIITGLMGATYDEMKIISYDQNSEKWFNSLSMGGPLIADLDQDGTNELISISTGSIPSYVDIYRWNQDHFEKASITENTNTTYAYLDNKNTSFMIEAGKIEQGEVKEKHYYFYKHGKLIEQQQ